MEKSTADFVIDIIVEGLIGNSGKFELAALSLAKALKTENPEIAKKINHTISSYALTGSALRGVDSVPLPVDQDSQLEMATIVGPNRELHTRPHLSDTIDFRINSFLEERKNISRLLDNNTRPSTSLLLTGQPGTGKTMLAKFIASELGKNLVVLDISASMSSLMGKTGHNLKRVIDYAKRNSCVLLFDEFDAIAKKRDDNTDLGEIKRVVNVLLMELDQWPVSSVFIATSNHPELLDKAIWRRFDHAIDLGLPELAQRKEILTSELVGFNKESWKDKNLEIIANLLSGMSAAEIQKFANNVKRRVILREDLLMHACINELLNHPHDKNQYITIFDVADREGMKFTYRDKAAIAGMSLGGVYKKVNKKTK